MSPAHLSPSSPPAPDSIESLRAQLAEARETLGALQTGDADAIVVQTPSGDRVFTLEGADRAYRALVETMPEGAASLTSDGTVLYANSALAKMLGVPLPQLFGARFERFIAPVHHHRFAALRGDAAVGTGRAELELVGADGTVLPAGRTRGVGESRAPVTMTLVVSDLTDSRRRERQERMATDLALAISAASDLPAAARALLEDVCRDVGVHRGEAWLPRDDSPEFVRAAEFGVGDEVARTIPERDLNVLVANAAASAQVQSTLARPDGTAPGPSAPRGGAIAMPVLAVEDPVCVLVLVAERWSSQDELRAHVMAVAVQHLGVFLERVRIGQELELRAQLLDLAHDAVIVLDAGERRITFWNHEAQAVYGYSSQEALGCVEHELLGAASPESRQAIDQALAGESHWHGELSHTCRDGRVIAISSRQALQRDSRGEPRAIIELNSDVTAQRQAEETNRRLATVVQSTHDAVLATTADGIITEWNHGAERLYGYSAAEAIGQPVGMLSVPESAPDESDVSRRVAAGESVDQHETLARRKDGSQVPVSLTVSPIRDAAGRIVAEARISRDITERRRHEQALTDLADHDSLTQLLNRRRFQDELERELARARRDHARGALLAIDLDHFKFINDSHGHHTGDRVLVQVADVFRRHLRATDLIARLGGDEFAVLLRGVDGPNAYKLAVGLLDAIGAETDAPEGIHRIAASIGIAPFMESERVAPGDLLIQADIALYDAKEAGRSRASVYDAALDRHLRLGLGLGWADRIRDALANDRFVLHAQPIVSLKNDSTPRYELLIRLIGEDGEVISPGTFLEVAERMDLIKDIDRWVMQNAVHILAGQQRAGNDVRLQVNVSAASLADPDLADTIAEELRGAGADGRGLCIEITESTAIINLQRAKRFAARLGELGCELALDDFGAGYASFYYLKHITFDYLKIDGEFIQNIVNSPTDHLVVETLANIARTMGKQTVAEYVGDRETIELLRGYGVDYAQGFYLAKPASLGETDLTEALGFAGAVS
jgi:diguanylate cyclase (GGDEF)-like protein/PAS domain S-box-containing protein